MSNENLPLPPTTVTVQGGVVNGGNSGAVVLGSVDADFTLTAAGSINIGSGPSNHVFLNGGLKYLHVDNNSAGPIITLTTDNYSVAYTNVGVTNVRLPSANANVGSAYILHHAHGGGAISIDVAPASGDLIDGVPSVLLTAIGQHINLISIGNNAWRVA